MDTFGQHFDLECAAGHTAQAGGEPELVVVARAAVEADHQRYVTQAVVAGRTQRVHVGQQVVGATFFAGLDQAHDTWVGCALALERLHGGDAGVHRVTIVGTAPAVQFAVFVFGSPGAQVVAPAGELGLFVEVAVHQHGLAGHGGRVRRRARRCCNLEKQHRGAPCEPHDFQRQAFDLLRLDPRGRVAHDGVDVAVLRPVRVKARRLGRNGDVVGELAHDVAVPRPGDVGQRLVGRKDGGGDAGVHGKAPAAAKEALHPRCMGFG